MNILMLVRVSFVAACENFQAASNALQHDENVEHNEEEADIKNVRQNLGYVHRIECIPIEPVKHTVRGFAGISD
jgi:hypothetical protein